MAGALPMANKAGREPDGLVRVEKLGLTVLYESKRIARKADVVFVHDLQGILRGHGGTRELLQRQLLL